MTAKGKEVAVHCLHIYLEVWGALGTIHQHRDAVSMSRLDNLAYRIYCTQHIAHMSHTDELGTRRDKLLQLVEAQQAIISDGDMLYHNTSLHRLKLPRYDIGVMLHLCDNHLVALLHLTLAERAGHQVDGLRCATCKDNFLYLAGIDELTHLFACSLMQISGLL